MMIVGVASRTAASVFTAMLLRSKVYKWSFFAVVDVVVAIVVLTLVSVNEGFPLVLIIARWQPLVTSQVHSEQDQLVHLVSSFFCLFFSTKRKSAMQ